MLCLGFEPGAAGWQATVRAITAVHLPITIIHVSFAAPSNNYQTSILCSTYQLLLSMYPLLPLKTATIQPINNYYPSILCSTYQQLLSMYPLLHLPTTTIQVFFAPPTNYYTSILCSTYQQLPSKYPLLQLPATTTTKYPLLHLAHLISNFDFLRILHQKQKSDTFFLKLPLYRLQEIMTKLAGPMLQNSFGNLRRLTMTYLLCINQNLIPNIPWTKFPQWPIL